MQKLTNSLENALCIFIYFIFYILVSRKSFFEKDQETQNWLNKSERDNLFEMLIMHFMAQIQFFIVLDFLLSFFSAVFGVGLSMGSGDLWVDFGDNLESKIFKKNPIL
jgi:amino acid transporter